jgi:S-formylglutathione hydrolase FrmB
VGPARRRSRRSVARAVPAVALACLATAPAARAADLTLTGSERIDARLSELTLRTPAVAGPTRVRVLLPSGYARSQRRYPVLYLLHGAIGDQRSWTVQGDAEAITRGAPLIVVMPASGAGGGYANWYHGGRGGPPEWEDYHVDQLIGFIDRRYRTVAGRGGRAIAGLSMGGFGAMSYAARHPDLFGAAASFSGAVDTNNPLDIAITGDEPFGPRATQEIRWRGHNPTDLAPNLRGLRLVVRTGSGQPGGPFGGGDVVELAVHQMSVSFHERLASLRIGHVWDDYGPGGHLWPYWQRDLRETLPELMAGFRQPAAPPARVTFRAVEPRYGAYGWRVAVHRPALEFSELRAAGRRGFTLRGSGTARVTTPPLYRPGERLRVRVRDRRGTRAGTRVAGRGGRLRIAVDLGPGNRVQQDAPGATTRVFSAAVRVAGAGRRR